MCRNCLSKVDRAEEDAQKSNWDKCNETSSRISEAGGKDQNADSPLRHEDVELPSSDAESPAALSPRTELNELPCLETETGDDAFPDYGDAYVDDYENWDDGKEIYFGDDADFDSEDAGLDCGLGMYYDDDEGSWDGHSEAEEELYLPERVRSNYCSFSLPQHNSE